ncbi:MAG: hypothetical protein CSB01_02045 [Bacteroidia bacterium]|nr:MAG: hypothetical protein CSB01_02045 [Bacteroidia bacterium]
MTNQYKNQTDINQPTEDEIDLIQLAKVLWNERKKVIKITICFMLLGLFVAIFSEKEYTATTTIVPQGTKDNKLSNLGGLAAMAGINLGGGGNGTITPNLYPQVINSIPFKLELLKTKLNIEDIKKPITFQTYYEDYYTPSLFGYIKKYSIGLPAIIINAIRGEKEKTTKTNILFGKTLINISKDEEKLLKIIASKLSLNVNNKDNYVTLSASMPEALAAAQLTQRAQDLLQNIITNIKIEQAKNELEFVEKRFVEKKKEAEKAQLKLAKFSDQNKNVTTATAQTELQRLRAEYDVIYGVKT